MERGFNVPMPRRLFLGLLFKHAYSCQEQTVQDTCYWVFSDWANIHRFAWPQQLIHPKSFWHLSTIQINNLHLYLGTPPPPQKPYKPWRVESLETALSLLQHLWPAFEGRQLSCDPLSQSHTEGMVIGWQLLRWTRGGLPQAPVWWWPWNKRQHWVNTRRGVGGRATVHIWT